MRTGYWENILSPVSLLGRHNRFVYVKIGLRLFDDVKSGFSDLAPVVPGRGDFIFFDKGSRYQEQGRNRYYGFIYLCINDITIQIPSKRVDIESVFQFVLEEKLGSTLFRVN